MNVEDNKLTGAIKAGLKYYSEHKIYNISSGCVTNRPGLEITLYNQGLLLGTLKVITNIGNHLLLC